LSLRFRHSEAIRRRSARRVVHLGWSPPLHEGGDGLDRRDPDADEEEQEGGEAGEGSQSTGHPESAG